MSTETTIRPRPFDVHMPLERAYTRRMLFAVAVRDAVSLAPLSSGLRVTVTGLDGAPIVNADGMFVWLEEANRQPQTVKVDPGVLPYEGVEVPAPQLPARLLRVELAPRRDYGFAAGTTGVRGTLIEQRIGPRVEVLGAEVWLQWLDDASTWRDAPTHSHTNADGDFAAVLRFLPSHIPHPEPEGNVRVRLAARRTAGTRFSPGLLLPPGHVASDLPPFAWDEFQP